MIWVAIALIILVAVLFGREAAKSCLVVTLIGLLLFILAVAWLVTLYGQG